MKINKTILIILSPFIIIFLGIYIQLKFDPFDLTYQIRITDSRMYRDTPAYDLALAVFRENTGKIKKIVKENPELINIQDPHFGAPLIYFAVQNERYESLKTLLELGADPNIRATKKGGETALFAASCYAASDNDFDKDPKYVKLLLDYGADPNINDEHEIKGEYGVTNISPLMHSVGCGFERMLLLYQADKNLEHKNSEGEDILSTILKYSDLDWIEILQLSLLLIREHDLDVTFCKNYNTHKICLVDRLRDLTFPLNSEKHKVKMQIVDEFSKRGVDYWSTPIATKTLERIKHNYPDTWQEYIKKY